MGLTQVRGGTGHWRSPGPPQEGGQTGLVSLPSSLPRVEGGLGPDGTGFPSVTPRPTRSDTEGLNQTVEPVEGGGEPRSHWSRQSIPTCTPPSPLDSRASTNPFK